MEVRRVRPRLRALEAIVFTALTVLGSSALLAAGVLVPAPTAVLPLLAVACVGLPMLAAWHLAAAHAALGGIGPALRGRKALDEAAVAELRRALEQLPETAHPLDR